MANKIINQLDQSAEPILGSDKMIVSRDGSTLTQTTISKLPVSDAVQAALNDKKDLEEYTGAVANTNGLPDYVFSQLRNIRSQIPRQFLVSGNTVRLVFAGFQSGSSGEVDITGTLKLESYITIRGSSYRFQFNGLNYLEDSWGKIYISDELVLPFTYSAGEEWYETTQVSFTATGGQYLVYRDSPQFHGFSGWVSVYRNSATWTDMPITGGIVDTPSAIDGFATTNDFNYYGAYYGSCAILGKTTKPTFIIAGDSRQKLGASQRLSSCIKNRFGITGEVASYLAENKLPFINLGWSGESYTTALGANKYTQRTLLAQYGTVLIDCYGVNDIGAGASYAGTCTSTTTTSVTGASVTSTSAMVGDFIEGPGLWPNTRIESGSGATFTISRAPYAAITSFTLKRANTATLSAWQNFIKQFRTLLNWWDKPYFHNTIFPRNSIDTTTSVRSSSSATPVINYFNWLLKTGQLSAPIDRGDGVIRPLLDGWVDGASALSENGGTGVFKSPDKSKQFTSSDGITTTLNSAYVQSVAGSFEPWMTGHIIYIEGAGGTNKTNAPGSTTTLRGYVNYINPNWIVLSLPNTLQDATQSAALSYTRTTSVVNCNAGAAVSNTNAYIHNGNFDIDGLHLSVNGEIEITKKGNFSALEIYK